MSYQQEEVNPKNIVKNKNISCYDKLTPLFVMLCCFPCFHIEKMCGCISSGDNY